MSEQKETEGLGGLVELINAESKSEAVRLGTMLEVQHRDFVDLILGAQAGAIHPYKHANSFSEKTPPALDLTEADREALSNRTPDSEAQQRKVMTKLNTMFDQRKLLANHLFYTPNHQFWHIFYFSNRDQEEHRNHRTHGQHMHFINHHWGFPIARCWDEARAGKAGFPNTIHLRFKS